MLKTLYIRYKEMILYGVFGAGATVINIVVFMLLHGSFGVKLLVANVIAWIAAFLFAFITNKLLVFESKSWKGSAAIKEMFGFLVARLGTLVLDSALMVAFVEGLHFNSTFSKVFVNVVVIIVNYLASKFLIFKEKIV